MRSLLVGELFDPTRTSHRVRDQLRLGHTTQELIRFWDNPEPEEVEAHGSGAARFGLIDGSPHVLVLAYQFGDLPWSDAPFQIHRHSRCEPCWWMPGRAR